jgi:hypothetical protein
MRVLWPLGAALRGEASSRLMLRWLKTVAVSDEEKAPARRQAGTWKTTLLKRRNRFRRHQNRGRMCVFRDEPGGYPFTGRAVSGVEVA